MKNKFDLAYFRGRLRIDREQLDEELVQQPELFYHVSEQLARSISERDRSKDSMKLLMARLTKRATRKLESGGHRATVNAIQARVESHSLFVEAQDQYALLREQVDLWAAMKEAFAQRSYALKDLCGLFVANYYSESSVRGEKTDAVTDADFTRRRKRALAERDARKHRE